jgi:hypothetical protein
MKTAAWRLGRAGTWYQRPVARGMRDEADHGT